MEWIEGTGNYFWVYRHFCYCKLSVFKSISEYVYIGAFYRRMVNVIKWILAKTGFWWSGLDWELNWIAKFLIVGILVYVLC